MRGSNVGRAQIRPLRIEPEIGKPEEDAIKSSSAECRGVLDEDVGRLRFGDDAVHLEPEAASVAGEAGSAAGEGDVFAGEPAGDEVNRAAKRGRFEVLDIASDNSLRAQSRPKDMLTPLVDLDGSNETETEEGTCEDPSTDSCEEVQLTEHHSSVNTIDALP